MSKMNSMPDLSDEQAVAVQASHASLVVSAAAGSGKTRVLVERYLRHVVDEGFRADQILTITFTRKAAAEMKRRIVDRLTQRGLTEQAQIAETGPIQTIHGFCERLLRENALAAGLDPEFEILAEAEGGRLMEACIQDALSHPGDESEEASELIAKLAGRRMYGESLSPHARLEAAVREAVSGWRGTGVSLTYLEELHQNPVTLLATWRAALLNWVIPEARQIYESDTSGESFPNKLTAAYKSLRKAKPRFIRPSMEADMECSRDTCGLMQIACYAWRRFEAEMRRRQELDFTALESYGVDLIKRSPETRERLRAQYPVVLVDEAQDLNPVQHELLKALNPATEMFVGDHQQSIYGFRQADVKLFAEKLAFSNPTRLSRNYRSQIGILGFVDLLFQRVWEEAYQPMLDTAPFDYRGVEFWVQRQRDTHLTAEWIKELIEERQSSGGAARDVAVLVRRSGYAIDLSRALERIGVPCRVSGGTEQFYARLEVRDVANALEALVDPTDDFALAALLRSPFVGVSLDTIVLLCEEDGAAQNDKGKIQSRLKGFLSPVLPDNALLQGFLAWFEPLSATADRLAAWEILSQLLAKTPYLENLARREHGLQKIANVRKLLSLAVADAEVSPQEFAERIRHIQTIRHKEGDAPAGDQDADEVTIMTIHKSKGLEFPVVVLPDTHQRMSMGAKDVEVDPWLRLCTTKFGRSSSMFHEWLGSERQKREEEEEWRVMYVALTRAKEKLCIVVNPGGAGDKIGERIARLLKFRDAAPPGVRVRGLSGSDGR